MSCGKEKEKSKSTISINDELEVQSLEGHYRAIIRPINNSLSGWIPSGMAQIKILGDTFEVQTWLEDAAPNVHHQNIHLGTECPISNDLNMDGFVDVKEMIPTTKEILIPLDDQLDSVAIGVGIYPSGRTYQYNQKASLSKLMGELHQTILSPTKQLKLAGKIILIHGASPTTSLPNSVATIEGRTGQETVPIACGVLEKVEINEIGPQ
jgi:hypothetical protein